MEYYRIPFAVSVDSNLLQSYFGKRTLAGMYYIITMSDKNCRLRLLILFLIVILST